MAQTVVVSELPMIKEGLVIAPITDTAFSKLKRYKNKLLFEIKPKTGVWYNSFVAYPISEDSVVKGAFQPKALASAFSATSGTMHLTYRGKPLSLKYIIINSTISPLLGNMFICDKKPTLLITGEMNNPKKMFVIDSF